MSSLGHLCVIYEHLWQIVVKTDAPVWHRCSRLEFFACFSKEEHAGAMLKYGAFDAPVWRLPGEPRGVSPRIPAYAARSRFAKTGACCPTGRSIAPRRAKQSGGLRRLTPLGSPGRAGESPNSSKCQT